MHCHQCSVRNIGQGVFYRMKTGEATLYQTLRAGESGGYAVLAPLLYVSLRKYRDNMQIRNGRKEFFYSYTEYRFAAQFKELFGG